jgi:short-subunit dehydrogenase
LAHQPLVILVTGASSGIGAATARLFGQRGYRVVLAARRFDRLESLAKEIQDAGGQSLPLAADLHVLDDIENLVENTLQAYGQIDILFNNAGFGRMDWLENLDPEQDIERQLQVNLCGVVYMARAVLPHMLARRAGHIINMSSVAGLVATPTYSIYSASKFAVRGFTDALRREVGVYGVHVSGIYPGGVATEFSSHTGANRKTGITTPAFLQLSSEDVAMAVWRLAQRPRRILVIPWVMNLAVWVAVLFPGLVDRLIARQFVRPERLG